MKSIDLESLEWTLSQNDLKLTWHRGQSASGNERLDIAPIKANFFWKKETQTHIEYSIEATRDELSDVIKALESKDVKVPDEFYEALRNFPN